ncbi:NUDIX domain-containing protein [Effusibacillus pohliae]|uniref:NUDIX domain-containing protein n=1 Tax=Effusibacillus pohliae TaxID=232270 RepID=UPI00038200BB|nr:NUDIX domain-containing protein [Effusibacillus pohliae]
MPNRIHAQLTRHVDSYIRHYPDERERISPLLKQIHDNTDPLHRKTLPGHVTASGIVIENGKILMVFHPYIKKWLQPGGHVEHGETPLAAAVREVLEETGWKQTMRSIGRASTL